jgi:DNA-binding MarR family transcriptional regulator
MIDGGVSVKQMCNDLNVGRNIVIRVLKQAEKEEMITRERIPETNIELIILTDKGKEWIGE